MFRLKVVLNSVMCGSHIIFLFVHYAKLFMKHNISESKQYETNYIKLRMNLHKNKSSKEIMFDMEMIDQIGIKFENFFFSIVWHRPGLN